MPDVRCLVHPDEPPSARCASCARGLCDACWTRVVDDAPWCDDCIELLRQPTPVILYVAAAALASGVLALLLRKLNVEALYTLAGWAVGSVAAVITAIWLHRRAETHRLQDRARPRPPSDAGVVTGVADSAYRGRVRRLVRRVAPPVSGAMAALVVILALVLAAAAIPSALALPRWLEWQLVLAGWWLVWATAFGMLLYRGWRVGRDVPDLRKASGSGRSWVPDIGAPDLSCGADGEGCAVLAAIVVVFLAALLLAWLVVELVMPLLFVAAYYLVVRALTHVANDTHHCQGRLGASLGWGAVWAALYTAPLAVMVAVGQLVFAALAPR